MAAAAAGVRNAAGDSDEPFGDRVEWMLARFRERKAEIARLDDATAENLKMLGVRGSRP